MTNPMNLFAAFLKRRTADPRGNMAQADADRLSWYGRYLRAYQGYSIRGTLGSNTASDWRRIKFNYSQPIVNLSAGFFAAKPLAWNVAGDPDATKAAHAIWDRSGSDRTLLDAGLAACIYGDMVGVATQNEEGDPLIEFVEPAISYPTFDGADYGRLSSLEIAYQRVSDAGDAVFYREIWDQGGMTAFEDDREVETRTYDALPAAWIRNSSVKGMPYGISDLDGIWDLVEEYDHIAAKQTRIIDYYASPALVFTNVNKGDVVKNERTAFYLGKDADVKYLEWQGNTPDVEAQLTRIRNAIAEKSQVPAVAFGQADSGLTSISGIALQILYGPLIAKTRRKQASWGPCLEYLMWLCLKAAGYEGLKQSQVDVLWPDALPVDGREQNAILTEEVAAGLRSRRGAMREIGIEDPNEELRRQVVEAKLLALGGPSPDVFKAAMSATKGSPGDTRPAVGNKAGAATAGGTQAGVAGGNGGGGASNGAAPASPAALPEPPDPAKALADAMTAFDEILAEEDAAIEAARKAQQSADGEAA
jgi:hypothetical protein